MDWKGAQDGGDIQPPEYSVMGYIIPNEGKEYAYAEDKPYEYEDNYLVCWESTLKYGVKCRAL